ncbi:MAG: cysteine-rich CWC family protein [Planctomycetaceae bacterium]|nr:cysteine-rich CWC family protein [Planctomycetaceae bacterium]
MASDQQTSLTGSPENCTRGKSAGPTHVCPGCGAPVRCGLRAGDPACWCFDIPPVAVSDNQSDCSQLCWCPACLSQQADRQPANRQGAKSLSGNETPPAAGKAEA